MTLQTSESGGEMWAVFDVHVCDAMFQLFSLYRVGFLIIVDNSLTFSWDPYFKTNGGSYLFLFSVMDPKQESVKIIIFLSICVFKR